MLKHRNNFFSLQKKNNQIKNQILDVKDFPKNGVIFKDWTPILLNPKLFKFTIKKISSLCRIFEPDLIVAPESRGFWLGIPIAQKLKIGFVPFRKPKKLPRKTTSINYNLEYGNTSIEYHVEDIKPGSKVVIVDDVLATGGTAKAMIELLKKNNVRVAGCVFLIEIKDLKGSDLIKTPYFSFIEY